VIKLALTASRAPGLARNICEVCERALARTDTGMCDFCRRCRVNRAAPRRSKRALAWLDNLPPAGRPRGVVAGRIIISSARRKEQQP
jgi:hypothetical protein